MFDREPRVADDTEHGESIYGIMPGNGDGSAPIGHYNVPTLADDLKAGSLQSFHGLKMVDAG